MHKHITSVIAAVLRQRLRAALVLAFLLALVGCVVEPDSTPGETDDWATHEPVSIPDDDLVLDEDLDALDLEVDAAAAATGDAILVCRVRACAPGYFCCNGFCKRITPGVRCRDRRGGDTI